MSFFYPRKALTALQTSWPSFPSGNCLFSPRGWGGHFWDRFCIKIALNFVTSQTLDRGHKNGRLDVVGKPRMGRRERQWQRQSSVIRLVKRGKIIRLHVQPTFKYISLTRSTKWRRKFFQMSGSCGYNLSPQQLIRHSPPSHECILQWLWKLEVKGLWSCLCRGEMFGQVVSSSTTLWIYHFTPLISGIKKNLLR